MEGLIYTIGILQEKKTKKQGFIIPLKPTQPVEIPLITTRVAIDEQKNMERLLAQIVF